MARYTELAEEVMQKIRARRQREKNTDLPWPGYNGGRQFTCKGCGLHFDTSSGVANHQVYECKEKTSQ